MQSYLWAFPLLEISYLLSSPFKVVVGTSVVVEVSISSDPNCFRLPNHLEPHSSFIEVRSKVRIALEVGAETVGQGVVVKAMGQVNIDPNYFGGIIALAQLFKKRDELGFQDFACFFLVLA